MEITVSDLRANLYRIVDQVLETGIPVDIIRNGRRVHLVPDTPGDKLSRLKKRKVYKGKPQDLLNLDWSSTWEGHDLP